MKMKKSDEDKSDTHARLLNKKLKFKFLLRCIVLRRNGNHLAHHLDHYPNQSFPFHICMHQRKCKMRKEMVGNYCMDSHKMMYTIFIEVAKNEVNFDYTV